MPLRGDDLVAPGGPRRFAAMTEQFYGRIPGGLQIPLVRLPRGRLLAAAAAIAARAGLSARTRRRRLRRFLPAAPARSEALRARIATTATPAELAGLWQAQVAPLLHDAAAVGPGGGAGVLGNAVIRPAGWCPHRPR